MPSILVVITSDGQPEALPSAGQTFVGPAWHDGLAPQRLYTSHRSYTSHLYDAILENNSSSSSYNAPGVRFPPYERLRRSRKVPAVRTRRSGGAPRPRLKKKEKYRCRVGTVLKLQTTFHVMGHVFFCPKKVPLPSVRSGPGF